MPRLSSIVALISILRIGSVAVAGETPDKPLRAGMIGLDTSHCPAFTKIFNNPKNQGDLAGVKVVAAFPGGSADLPSSIGHVPEYTKQLREMGVEIVDSIPALIDKSDVILLMSVDGRPHLAQAAPVFKARKPIYIDKPLAGSLADALAIAELGKKYNVPWFSSSSLRYSPGILGMRNNQKLGDVLGCDAWSPCSLEEHHPDLYWYGIHGVETLYTIMGPGCQSVSRIRSPGTEMAVGLWKDGRIGTFRGIRTGRQDYGAMVFGSKAILASGPYVGYEPLCVQIAKFFKTGKPPLANEETLEIMAFMEAADESKRQAGAPVKLEDVVEKAKPIAQKRLAEVQ